MNQHPLPEEGVREPDGAIAMTVAATLVRGRTETVPVTVHLSYDRLQPFAVLLDLPTPDGRRRARWSFARDLLQSGLHRASGEGDVRIWPPCRCNDRPDARLFLRDGTASVLLDVPSQPLREWLVRTWVAVPPGEENRWIDWDTVVGRLLDGC
ncbi:SsgA family sporulation/cell division regulator [Streptomyces misionensis]|uniref:SsgA family sporulation/cell division regulator n=1 Tax=Streptomyces misionensis TaxID=67331 RepID=A0A5C6K0K2_9ACTN|nr:SsgA family sporulation/cell division regulator [Streptomyces misionensis]TWV53823.1 SsgA family sporulation/cell division regulator [Streptomyces misionensis]